MTESSLIHFVFCKNKEILATLNNDQKVWSHIQKLQRKLGEKFYLLPLTVSCSFSIITVPGLSVKMMDFSQLGGIAIVKWIKGQRISWLGHLERMEEDRMPKKIFTQELEGTKWRRRPRKGWREEVERDLQVLGVRRWRGGDRYGKMERICLTGQSPQQAVAPMEEEEEGWDCTLCLWLVFGFVMLFIL